MLDAGFDRRVRMALRGQHLFNHARGIFDLDGIFDCFLGNADPLFAKSLQHVRLRDTLQTFELYIANDGQLFDFKDYIDAAARADFGGDAGCNLVEKPESQDRLQVARDLGIAVCVTRSRLNVIEDVVFAQSAITEDVDVFDQARWWLLRARTRCEKERSGNDDEAQNSEPDDAIRVHKCRFPSRFLWGLYTANEKLSAYFRKTVTQTRRGCAVWEALGFTATFARCQLPSLAKWRIIPGN